MKAHREKDINRCKERDINKMMWRFQGFSSMDGLFMLGFKVLNTKRTS
jgi:hypothetical protein